MPSMPLLPLMSAVDMHSDVQGTGPFNWSSIDIITNRNNLQKLLRWASSSTKEVFRIDTSLLERGLFYSPVGVSAIKAVVMVPRMGFALARHPITGLLNM
jgi:hypothetical protein